MKVIMNADDFGFSKGVNLGIIEGFKKGIITSTSLMVNMPGFDHAISLMKQYPDLLHVGIHLVTTVQYAVSGPLKTLTDENGHFYHDVNIINNCDQNEIELEYQAQMDKFLATGLKPDHIDFHFCHTKPQIIAGIKLAKKYNLPMRAGNKEIEKMLKEENITYAKNHIPDFYDHGQVDVMLELLQTSLENNHEIIEFAVHPAYVDFDLLNLSSYNTKRAIELNSLLDERILSFIKEHDIELINFSNL